MSEQIEERTEANFESERTERDRVNDLESRMEDAKMCLDGLDKSVPIALIHHNDADGITSRYIMGHALESEGFRIESYCLERAYPNLVAEIYRRIPFPIMMLDLRTSLEEGLDDGRPTFFIDHHTPGEGLDTDNVFVMNYLHYGIGGDRFASSSTMSYKFAKVLNPSNQELADIAIIGAVGDKNHEGSCSQQPGFRRGGYDEQAFNDTPTTIVRDDEINVSLNGEPYVARILAKDLLVLGSIGYHSDGVQTALDLLQGGYDPEIDKTQRLLEASRESAYAQQRFRIKRGIDVFTTDDIFYFNVGDTFKGMGVKTVGDFCNDLIDQANKNPEEYEFLRKYGIIIGGQQVEPISLGDEMVNPLDPSQAPWVKTSIRTTLFQESAMGCGPHIGNIVAEVNPEYCSGCHEQRGATDIPLKDEYNFLKLFQNVILEASKER